MSLYRVYKFTIVISSFGLKSDANGEGSTMRNFIVCTVHLK